MSAALTAACGGGEVGRMLELIAPGARRGSDLEQGGGAGPLSDPVRKGVGESADLGREQDDRHAAATRERLRRLLTLTGEQRALDVGTGAGSFAIALAPLVREVIGVDVVPEMLEEGRKRAPANVELVEADATALPYELGSFDLVCTAGTLHHVPRPELVLAEMNRVLRPGGTMLVVDQLAPVDSLAAIELNRFERARDPLTTRILADVDLRGLFDANGLVLRHAEIVPEERDLDRCFDLAGCHGDERERARALANRETSAQIGWYVLDKPGL